MYCSGITRKLSEYNFKIVCNELPGGHLVSVRQRASDFESERPSGSAHIAPRSHGFSTALAGWKTQILTFGDVWDLWSFLLPQRAEG